MAFISPSGDGLKVAYRLTSEITDHNLFSNLYRYHADMISGGYGVPCDKTHDVSRPCYLSHDPDLYLNLNAEPLPVVIPFKHLNKKLNTSV